MAKWQQWPMMTGNGYIRLKYCEIVSWSSEADNRNQPSRKHRRLRALGIWCWRLKYHIGVMMIRYCVVLIWPCVLLSAIVNQFVMRKRMTSLPVTNLSGNQSKSRALKRRWLWQASSEAKTEENYCNNNNAHGTYINTGIMRRRHGGVSSRRRTWRRRRQWRSNLLEASISTSPQPWQAAMYRNSASANPAKQAKPAGTIIVRRWPCVTK